MRSAPFLEIIDRLEGLDVDDRAQRAFRRLLLEIGTRHGISGLERNEQLDFVRKLLALRVSRPTIRNRLMALYSVSRRQAYRLIHEALKAVPREPLIGTQGRENRLARNNRNP